MLQGTPLYDKLRLDQGIERGKVMFLEDQHQMRGELNVVANILKVASYALIMSLELWTSPCLNLLSARVVECAKLAYV